MRVICRWRQGMFRRRITSGVHHAIKGMEKQEGKHMQTHNADALYVTKMSRMIECQDEIPRNMCDEQIRIRRNKNRIEETQPNKRARRKLSLAETRDTSRRFCCR